MMTAAQMVGRWDLQMATTKVGDSEMSSALCLAQKMALQMVDHLETRKESMSESMMALAMVHSRGKLTV